jgi:hypothetical protein
MPRTDTISPQTRQADGLQVRYAETEPVDGATVLLLNPWPESLYAIVGACATDRDRPAWVWQVGGS